MATRVGSLYAEIGADTSGLKKGLKEAQTGLKDTAKSAEKSSKPIKEIWGTAVKALGVVAAVGYAAKKAFDLGAQGAQLEYAAGKFNRLTESVGATSDAMLVDLRAATKGTLSDAKLMAGAGDLMALGLAKSKEEVVRLSKVVGGLGMDMNQLVLTLTNQTTMRFDALGVSVDGFDAKVAALKKTGMSASDAFKEAFLQQAEEQLTKVGDKADTGAGSIARMEASVENLSNNFKMNLAPSAVKAADAINKLLVGTRDLNIAIGQQNTEAINQNISYQEYTKLIKEATKDTDYFIRETDDGIQVVKRQAEGVKVLNGELGILSQSEWNAVQSSRNLTGAYDEHEMKLKGGVIPAVDAAAIAIDNAAAAEDRAYRNARNWKSSMGETVSLLDRLNTMDINFGDTIKNQLDKMAWDAAGGDVIQGAAGRINKAWEAGRITEPQAEEMLKELYVASETLEADMNGIDLKTLAQTIADDLHIPLDEATKKAQGVIDAIDAGALKSYVYTIEIKYNDGGYHPAWAGKDNTTIVATGSAGGQTPKGPPKASGGTVNAGTSYWVGERGPEPFIPSTNGTIIPNNQLGGDTIIQNIYMLPGENAAAFANRVLASLSRGNRRAAAGAGYAGV